MNAQEKEAILILAGAARGSRDAALTTIAAAVTLESEYGDPDDSLMDWLGNGSFTDQDTVESIAAEWDDREV